MGSAQGTVSKTLQLKHRFFYQNLYLKVSYSRIGAVVTSCKRSGGKVIDIKYNPAPIIEIQIRQNALEAFQSQLQGIGVGTQ